MRGDVIDSCWGEWLPFSTLSIVPHLWLRRYEWRQMSDLAERLPRERRHCHGDVESVKLHLRDGRTDGRTDRRQK